MWERSFENEDIAELLDSFGTPTTDALNRFCNGGCSASYGAASSFGWLSRIPEALRGISSMEDVCKKASSGEFCATLIAERAVVCTTIEDGTDSQAYLDVRAPCTCRGSTPLAPFAHGTEP